MSTLETSENWYRDFVTFIESAPSLAEISSMIQSILIKRDEPGDYIKAFYSLSIEIHKYANQELRLLFVDIFRTFVKIRFNIEISEQACINNADLNDTDYFSFQWNDLEQLKKIKNSLDILYANHKSIPKDQNIYKFNHQDLLNNIEILYLFTSPEFLQRAENYLKIPPIIAYIQSWISFAGFTEPKEAQFFHLDYDDFAFCKGFVYLTDVDENSGPHTYFPKSNNLQELLRNLPENNIPRDGFLNWYSKLRKSEEESIYYLNRLPVKLTGPKGTCILGDTMSIHRGELPKSKNRHILTASFHSTPMIHSPKFHMADRIPFSAFKDLSKEHKLHFSNPKVQYALHCFIDFSK